MNYIPKIVQLTFTVPSGASYAYLYSNNGSGAISWTTSFDGRKHILDDSWVGSTYTATVVINAPGDWIFGFKVYDSKGNISGDTPGTVSVYIDLKPDRPGVMTLNSYMGATDTLVLNV